MNRKAQAAMEYLMTYGWAILIVIIVAAALYAFGIFNPATWTGTRATGFANIGVPQDWKYNANGTLEVIVRNGYGRSISISSVNASCNTSAGESNVMLTGASESLGTGLTRTYSTAGPVQCSAISPGSSFSVQLIIIYVPQGRTFSQTDMGVITGSAT